MSMEYFGTATGPTPEMLAAEPYISAGFWLMILAFLCYLGFAILALKNRVPGRWFTLSGLMVFLAHTIFHNTLAPDAELDYGPYASALEFITYGTSGLFVAVGYARLVWHSRKNNNAR